MSKCYSCTNHKLEAHLEDVVDRMLDRDYEKNDDGQYIIPYDGRHDIIDGYIADSMYGDDVKSLVDCYGVFKAIKLYQNEFGEFNFDEDCFMKTYGTLAYVIIDTHLHEKDIICEEEDKDEVESDEDEESEEDEDEDDTITLKLQPYYDNILLITFSPYKKNDAGQYVIPKNSLYKVIENAINATHISYILEFVNMYGFDKAYEDLDYAPYEEIEGVKDTSIEMFKCVAGHLIENYVWNLKLYNDNDYESDSDEESDEEKADV